MSEGKHTPGPWRAVRGDDLVFVEVVNIAHIGVSGGDAGNAQFVVQAAPGSKGSLPHDAVLIAAAPELLRELHLQVRNCPVCRGTTRAVDVFDILSSDGPHEEKDCKRCSSARAAISKAKGINPKVENKPDIG